MKYAEKRKSDALCRSDNFSVDKVFGEAPATADLCSAGDTLMPIAEDERIGTDYSEEAIPERDPAYRLWDGTLSDAQTVEHMPAAERLALARCLEQLGMNRTRAVLVANL